MARSASGLVATLFIDLDDFKAVNDRYGHQVGDRLLSDVGERLTQTVREPDLVARYGGDEFVVVCEVPDAGTAHSLAERVRQAIERPFGALRVHASIGLCVAPAERAGGNHDVLVRMADHAMFAAKTAGGNRIAHADVEDVV